MAVDAPLPVNPGAVDLPRSAGPLLPPEAMLAVSIVSIQIGSALAATLFDRIGPDGVAVLKSGLAALSLALVARVWRGGPIRPHLGWLLAYGAIMAVMFASFYETLDRLPLGVAATIGFLGPLGVAIAHARRLSHFAWAALALGGVVLLTPELFASGTHSSIAGLAWAAVSALSWAAFVIVSPRVGARLPGLRGLAIAMALATLLLLPYGVIEGGLAHVTPDAVGLAFVVALLTTTVPLAMEFSALRTLSARGYGMIVSTEPAVAAIAGAALLGQSLGLTEAGGIACVCAASFGMAWSDRRA